MSEYIKEILGKYNAKLDEFKLLKKQYERRVVISETHANYIIDAESESFNYRVDFKFIKEPVSDAKHALLRVALMRCDYESFLNCLLEDPRLFYAFDNLLLTMAKYYQKTHMFELLAKFGRN
jgi:hypothetical protein